MPECICGFNARGGQHHLEAHIRFYRSLGGHAVRKSPSISERASDPTAATSRIQVELNDSKAATQ